MAGLGASEENEQCDRPGEPYSVLAIGARPLREVSQLADEAGVPWVMAGDCNNVPGDFLTAIRDASMIAWAAEERLLAPSGEMRAMGKKRATGHRSDRGGSP